MPADIAPGKQGDDQDGAKFPSPEEVICILPKQSSEGSADDIYEILSLKEGQQDGKPSFTLCRSSFASGDDDENKTLQSLLDNFLIYGPPVHLKPRPQRRVHVLVSTLSGTGLGMEFYTNVLAPLLEILGLAAAGEPEPGVTRQQGAYRLVVTQDEGSVKKFAREIGGKDGGNGDGDESLVREKGPEHTVVLLSGDGGIVDVLNGIASTQSDVTASGQEPKSQSLPLLAILPLGTGNALFNSLHKTVKTPAAASDLVQGLRTLLRGTPAPLPSFKAVFPEGSRTITYSETSGPTPTSGSATEATPSIASLEEQTRQVTHLYGVVVASYGFHSQLVWESDTPAYRQHGAKRFQMVAQELLKESHAYRATVQIVPSSSNTTEEETVSPQRLDRDSHAYILATLVSNLEKTFCISPASRPLDGQLRLVHFGLVDGAKTMEIMMAAYDGGKHVDMRWGDTDGEGQRVGYEEISEVRITTHEEDARWRKVCIDGTIVEIPAGGCMVVRKETGRHLRVLVDGSIVSNLT
jgi:diacylglycerol kinase family enzyme